MIFPLITGVVLDHLANGYTLLFTFCSAGYLIAFGLNHAFAPSFQRIALDGHGPRRGFPIA